MLGWGAFELWVIAMGAGAIFPAVPYAVWVILAGVLTTALTIWPLGSIRVLRRYVTIGVIIAMVWFTWFFLRQAPAQEGGSWTAFPAAVDYVIALSVSWVPMAADFARHSRSTGAAFTGVVGGYTLAQVACLGLGVYAVAIAGNADAVFGTFVAVPLGALFFAILVLRETDQSFANVYSTTVSLQNLMPRVDRRAFSVAIGVLTVVIALLVDVTSYGAFLGVIGAVFVPMFAVLAVDYFLLGGARRWNTEENAPSRWSMLVPWALGFVAYWLTTSTPTVAAWDGFWAGVREAIGFTRQVWMNGALGGALVAALVTLLIGLLLRGRR
jgi:purine-cytosine permease-like protein